MVDLRPHFVALGVVEAPCALVREGDVRCPPKWKASALGAEDHELEAEAPAIVGDEMSRVVPPLGEPVMRTVVTGKGDRQWIVRSRALRRARRGLRTDRRPIRQDRPAP
jgi:hypothetical protein